MPRSEHHAEPITRPVALLRELSKSESFVDWFGVPLHRETFEGENALEVFAGTSAPQGGNTEHGAQTVLMISDLGNTAFRSIRVLARDEPEAPSGFAVILGGDSEAATFADALEFAAKTIRRQLRQNHAGQG